MKNTPCPKPDRNEPCHCGSGKKYKKCCLDRDQEAERLALETRKREEEEAARARQAARQKRLAADAKRAEAAKRAKKKGKSPLPPELEQFEAAWEKESGKEKDPWLRLQMTSAWIDAHPDLALAKSKRIGDYLVEDVCSSLVRGHANDVRRWAKAFRRRHPRLYVREMFFQLPHFLGMALRGGDHREARSLLKLLVRRAHRDPETTLTVANLIWGANRPDLMAILFPAVVPQLLNSPDAMDCEGILDPWMSMDLGHFLDLPAGKQDPVAHRARQQKTVFDLLEQGDLRPQDGYLEEVLADLAAPPVFYDPDHSGSLKDAQRSLHKMGNAFLRYLHDVQGLCWATADFFRFRVLVVLGEKLGAQKPRRDLYQFTPATLQTALDRCCQNYMGRIPEEWYPALNGLFWLADFLQTNQRLSAAQAEEWRAACRSVFEAVYPGEARSDFGVRHFRRFPMTFSAPPIGVKG